MHIVRAMMRILGIAPVLVSACALGGDPSGSVDQAASGQASVSLASSSAALTQTSNTSWTLAKTGAVDTSSKTVTWTITATKGTTVSGQLVVSGFMAVTNSGGLGATIGNIVVNLQTKSGSAWKSVSVDVADATNDDAATTAHIDAKASSENLATFTENAASGHLLFEDASTNTLFSLVPEVTIPPGATKSLLFSASFDNHVLNLPVGKAVRAEVIVSFGNAGPQQPSAANVDINGNGTIDADEHYVRSVPTRLGLTVPAQTPDNASVAIHDAASNITTTGTVSFSNASFNLGATTGTVSVSYDAGASGGTITNCATLTGTGTTITVGGFPFPIVSGINAQACDAESIGVTTCTPGATGCGWTDGDLTTYPQAAWGDTPTATNAAGLLENNYDAVYLSTAGVFEIGIPGTSGYSMQFGDATSLLAYLPASGTIGPLVADLSNPTTSASGAFGGEVAALKLNIDFSADNVLTGTAHVPFGSLTLCGFTTLPALNTIAVSDFAAQVNTLLGGGSLTSGYTIADLDQITASLNASFGGGSVSTFAQDHLVNGSCP